MNKKLKKLLISAVSLILLFLISPEVHAQITWMGMNSGTEQNLLGISGSSHKDVFSVGAGGTIIYYDEDGNNDQKRDLKWENQGNPQVVDTNLNAVWRRSHQLAYAVGEGGTIYVKRKNNEWEKKIEKPRYGNLKGVWGSTKKNIFVVGTVLDPSDPSKVKGIILHSTDDGESWLSINTENGLNSVWGTSKRNVFAVGDQGTILHYDGNDESKWIDISDFPRNRRISAHFKAVWGSSENNIFVVGALDSSDQSGPKGIILHSTDGGNSWISRKTDNSLEGVWGSSEINVYAVGDNGTILHYDGNKKNKWSDISTLTGTGQGVNFKAVWVSTNPHVFIIGEDGIVLHSSGYWIKGKIFDACSGEPIEGAQVWEKQNDNWIFKGTTTEKQDGDIEYDPFSLNQQSTLRFTATNYYNEEANVTLLSGRLIDNYTFMIPNNGYQNSIAGLITEQQGSYHYPIESVTVYLYEAVDCEFPAEWDDYTSTNSGGHYSFTGLSAGTYKVEPIKDGYTFTPQYPVLLHTSPQMYDFTPSQ